MSKYTIEKITSKHIPRHNNVRPSDVGLWCYFINGRAYGFTPTEEEAIAKAESAVGVL